MRRTLLSLTIAFSIIAIAWLGFAETNAAPQGSTTLSAGQILTIKANGCALKVTKNTHALVKVKCVATSAQNAPTVNAPNARVILSAGQRHAVKPNQCTLVITRKKPGVVKVRCDAIVTNTPTFTHTPSNTPTNTPTDTPTNTPTPGGVLDSTFGNNGKVISNIGSRVGSSDVARAIAVQTDGKFVAGGYSYDGAQKDFALIRYNTNGSLDSSFGSNGRLILSLSSGDDEIHGLAMQTDGKILVGGSANINSNGEFAIVRFNSDGSLDTSFGASGKIITPVSNDRDYIQALAVQPDGKIVAAGVGGTAFVVVRYNSDGSLDAAFDGDGKVLIPSFNGANAVAIQTDNKIVVAGYGLDGSVYGSYYDIVIVRLNPDGSFDMSFDTDGMLTTGINKDDVVNAIAIQSDGKIVVAGYTDTCDYFCLARDAIVLRYDSTGKLDPSFGTAGIVTTNLGSNADEARALAIQNSGEIVVGGIFYNTSDRDFVVLRYSTDGLPDSAFDADGKATVDLGSTDEAYALVISGNQIILAGSTDDQTNQDFALVRYNSNGSLDPSFGNGGKVITNFGSTPFGIWGDDAKAIALQSDQKIVVAGTTHDGTHSNVALARYNMDGTLDLTFGLGGKVITSIGSDANVSAIKLQTDDKILVAGSEVISGKANDFMIVRYNPSGTLDTSFGSAGKVTMTLGTRDDIVQDIIIQQDGKLVAVGYTDTGSYHTSIALVRFNADGTLDGMFGSSGIVQTSLTGFDKPQTAALQSDGKLVVAGFANYSAVVLRYNSDGSLDTSLDGDGIAPTGLVGGPFYAARVYNINIQPDGKIILGGDYYGFSVMRFNANGSIDTTFGNNGIAQLPKDGGGGTIPTIVYGYGLTRQSDGKIVVAGNAGQTFSESFALARLNSDGSVDNYFGNQGVVTTSFTDRALVYCITLQTDSKLIAAGITGLGPGSDFALARYLP